LTETFARSHANLHSQNQITEQKMEKELHQKPGHTRTAFIPAHKGNQGPPIKHDAIPTTRKNREI